MNSLPSKMAVCVSAAIVAALVNQSIAQVPTYQLSPFTPRFEDGFDASNVGMPLNETFATRLNEYGIADGQWGWEGADNFVIIQNPEDPNDTVLRHLADDVNASNQGDVACLPYRIRGELSTNVYEVLAEVQLSTGTNDIWGDGHASWTDTIAIGWMNNGPDRGSTFAEGRGELAVELFYASEQDFADGMASYRIMARGDHHILASSLDTGVKFDMNNGLHTVELAWNANNQTVTGRINDVDLVTGFDVLSMIDGIEDRFNGDLSGIVLAGGSLWTPDVDGLGLQIQGAGGILGSFSAIPEPTTMLIGMISIATTGFGFRLRIAA